MIQNTKIIKGMPVTFTWVDCIDYKNLGHLTQSYGICFDKKGSIMIGRKNMNSEWLLPGGSIEVGETPEQTLIREADEEVSILLDKISFLGAQRVDFPGNPNKKEGDVFYQLRYVAIIDKIKELTPDPDGGNLWERKLIRPDEFLNYLNWGPTGKHIITKAYDTFQSWKDKK